MTIHHDNEAAAIKALKTAKFHKIANGNWISADRWTVASINPYPGQQRVAVNYWENPWC